MNDPFFLGGEAAPARSSGSNSAGRPVRKRSSNGAKPNNFKQRKRVKDAVEDGPAFGEDSDDGGRFEYASEEDEADTETAQEKRLRLAHEYVSQLESHIDADKEDKETDQVALRLRNDALEEEGRLFLNVGNYFEDFQAGDDQWGDVRWCRGHKHAVTCLCVSGNSKFVYSGGKDCAIIKWDIKTGTRLHTFKGGVKQKSDEHPGHTDHVLALAVTSDDRYLASGGRDKTIFVWDLNNLSLVKRFRGHKGPILSLAFRKGSRQLFSAADDMTLKVWSLDEMAYVESLYGHKDAVSAVDCLYRERCVSVGSRDRSVRVWKIIEETQLVFEGKAQDDSFDSVALVDESTFVTGSQAGTLALWGLDKKRPFTRVKRAHGDEWIYCVASMKHTDMVASGSCDGFIKLWRIDAKKTSLKLAAEIPMEGCINHIAFSHDRRFLVCAVGTEQRLGRWNPFKAKNGIRIIPLPDTSKA